MKNGLLFERFLNPERDSDPDKMLVRLRSNASNNKFVNSIA